MASEQLRNLLVEWKGEYQLLQQESESLLRNFDSCSRGGEVGALRRRQEIIEGFQKFDAEVKMLLQAKEADPLVKSLLDDFRAYQKLATEKIMGHNGLVMALAEQRLADIKHELAGLVRRKSAVTAYGVNSSTTRRLKSLP